MTWVECSRGEPTMMRMVDKWGEQILTLEIERLVFLIFIIINMNIMPNFQMAGNRRVTFLGSIHHDRRIYND